MNVIWLCFTSVLSFFTLVFCDQSFDMSRIRVFPAENQSIAGVSQVGYLNEQNSPIYAFNASEARNLCLSLGVNIASKAQVTEALMRGLETCRYGWIDEHFAVIPRRKALSICGQNQTGLVAWRAPVTQKFDVFCFNESDAAAQLKNMKTDSPLTSTGYSVPTPSPSESANSTQIMPLTSSSSLLSSPSSTPNSRDNELEPALFTGGAQDFSHAKAILITSTCVSLFIALFILAYIKIRRSRAQTSDMKQQLAHIQTDEQMCVKNIKQTKTDDPDEQRIEVDDNAS